MKFLCISACTDPFSYTPMRVQLARNSLDYSMRDLEINIRDYENALKSGQFSRILIHMIDVNSETGEVTVDINRVGENPLKTKKVINPDAAAVREARLARAKAQTIKIKSSQSAGVVFTTTTPTPIQWPSMSMDELGLGDTN
jgi:hypothetical protein